MSSRDAILAAIRKHPLEQTPLPTLNQDWIQYPDRVAQFTTVIETVGGRCIPVSSEGEINSHLKELPQFASAIVRCSTVDGIGEPTLDAGSVAKPHDLLAVDFAVLRGEFCVAENGAVWITDEPTPHRALYFITQHLALVVPRSQIVSNLHEAYQRLAFEKPRFGAFLSGPSKTADIEQSLVIGAQGPRSHVVFLLDDGA
ncbi:MAG: LUD domain-containing protein [Planctomycetota bacterium]|nr:LUD domain-containing protein [Planctomycetota bacterium]MDA1250657.1 LUD domain-containing protein [Planctomycetota bacterium]